MLTSLFYTVDNTEVLNRKLTEVTRIEGPTDSRKTFTLDLVWYALTGTWISYSAREGRTAYLEVSTETDVVAARYARGEWKWRVTPGCADVRLGFKAVRDFKTSVVYLRDDRIAAYDAVFPKGVYPKIFKHDTVFEKSEKASGLLFDWSNWSYNDNLRKEISDVIQELFANRYQGLARGYTRISLYDARAIPMLSTKQGDVPIPYLPWHTRRVLALVYLLFLMREERTAAGALLGKKIEPDESPLLLLVDSVHDFSGIRLLESSSVLSSVLGSPIQWVVTSR